MKTAQPWLVHGILHCNLNTGDVAAAGAFYAGLLGLSRRMRTRDEAGDGSALGIEGSTDTDTWFYYDGRGPRVAPGLEILQWNSPAPARRPSPGPGHNGLLALGYRVPDPAAVRSGTESRVERSTLPYRGKPHSGLRLADPDGMMLELVADGARATEMSHIRIGCWDLVQSTLCYTALGFRELAPQSRLTTAQADLSAVSLALPQDPSFTLELVQWHRPGPVPATAGRANSQGLYRIALACQDIKAAAAALVRVSGWRAGQPVYVPLPGSPLAGLDVIFMTGPDEVVVELVERPVAALSRTGRSAPRG